MGAERRGAGHINQAARERGRAEHFPREPGTSLRVTRNVTIPSVWIQLCTFKDSKFQASHSPPSSLPMPLQISSLEMTAGCSPALSALVLLLLVPTPYCVKDLGYPFHKWNYREGAGMVDLEGKHSVTQTLEKWGNTIFYQCKEILMNRPHTLLPEYSGVRPLSEALDDLLQEIHALKKRLVELNDRLDVVSKALPPISYSAALSKSQNVHPRRNPGSGNRGRGHQERRREKLTQPPHRPYPLKRRVYIRRKVKSADKPTL